MSAPKIARPAITRDGGAWVLVAPFKYADGPRTISIPRGFRFDLASIPRPLWALIAPFELSIAAPLVHDVLYRFKGMLPAGQVEPFHRYTRAEADALFHDIMHREGVSWWRRRAAYAAVRSWGWMAWDKP